MGVEIKVPALGESITEATIAKWFKSEGDSVAEDEVLVELETDKVTMEINASTSGALSKITAPEGATVTIGQIVGEIEAGAKGAAKAEKKEDPKASNNQTQAPATIQQPANSVSPQDRMSPAAKKIVAENNLNPANITGSARHGTITKADALNAQSFPVVSVPQTQSVNSDDQTPRQERVKMTRLRQRIAERLKESQNTAAILSTFNEIDMYNVINLRNKFKEEFQKKHGVKLGFMSFFVKACINALKELPSVNAEIDGNEIVYKNHYDIGVAVGTEQGLVVPVVRNADKMSFMQIEQTITDLGKKARDGKLSMADLSGGTFTVSNGGVYGSLLSTPIINPPQSGILGMHKTMERPVVVDGKIEIRPMMYIALSYDHRIIDGKEAVTFLVKVKENIENPERLLFDL